MHLKSIKVLVFFCNRYNKFTDSGERYYEKGQKGDKGDKGERGDKGEKVIKTIGRIFNRHFCFCPTNFLT